MSKARTIGREKAARALEARADALLRERAADRVQPHSRALPTEAEQAEAKFAARQLRIAADDLRAGMEN